MRRGKIYFITLTLVLLLVVCIALYSYIETSYSASLFKDSYVKSLSTKSNKEYYEKEFEVSINNKKHTVKFIGEQREEKKYTVTNYILACKLLFDERLIKDVSYVNHGIQLANLDEIYGLSERDFSFVKGVEGKDYLTIRFGLLLFVLNDNGKQLVHKPFTEELNYFSYVINYDSHYLDKDYKISFKDEAGNDMVSKYFYKDELFSNVSNKLTQLNDGYVSTKVVNDKIYSFVIAPDLSSGFYDDRNIYLYENEYVIYNDELYYKQLHKYEIHGPITNS